MIPMGGQVKAFLDEYIHFQPVAAAPVVVPVPVAAATATSVQALAATQPANTAGQTASAVTCTTCR